MGEPRRWRRLLTVRARTTIAATVVVGVALLLGSLALMKGLEQSLVDNVDEVAEVRAEDIASLARQGPLPQVIEGTDEDSIVQVVDADGDVIAASENVRGDPPVSTLQPDDLEAVAATLDDVPTAPGRFRIVALLVVDADPVRTVYVASSLDPASETLALLRTSLLVGGPLLLALVSVLTWIIVGRALQPVEAIRAQVADISSRHLDRRVPVPDTDDEIHRLAGTMNAMLDRLQATVEQQRRFVADASHELQTPLAAARTDLEVALAHPDAADWRDTARDLLAENGHMERLVADLLFIARADDSAPLPAPTPIDLHEVVFAEVARRTPRDGLRIETSGISSAFVLGRRDDLARAVRNLLDNAERHAASTVSLELRSDNGTVTLVVADDGPGVPRDQRERIFERFTRLDDARSRSTGGTGLGLAIVKEIVERHRGHLRVDDSPGGARFVIALPAD